MLLEGYHEWDVFALHRIKCSKGSPGQTRCLQPKMALGKRQGSDHPPCRSHSWKNTPRSPRCAIGSDLAEGLTACHQWRHVRALCAAGRITIARVRPFTVLGTGAEDEQALLDATLIRARTLIRRIIAAPRQSSCSAEHTNQGYYVVFTTPARPAASPRRGSRRCPRSSPTCTRPCRCRTRSR